MSLYQLNRDFFDKPIVLSEFQIKDPIMVIRNFFEDYRLSELRDIQDRIQRLCLTSDESAFNESSKRSNLLSYNDKLIRLLEAAFYLKDSFVPLANELKTEVLPKRTLPVRKFDSRVSDLVKGINDVMVDVSKLCLVIVNAWTEKVCAEFKVSVPQSKRAKQSISLPSVDLDKLHSMALTLQNKLASLAGVAVNILIV